MTTLNQGVKENSLLPKTFNKNDINFEPFTLSHFDVIYDFLKYATVDDSAFSITSILAWQRFFNPKVYISDDFILMTIEEGDKVYFNSPLVKDKEKYALAVQTLENLGVTRIQMVLSWQAEILKTLGYSCQREERNMSEYLYDTERLSTLSGKKYHSKRNFINTFSHKFEMRPYSSEDYEGVISLLDKWHSSYSGNEVNTESSWSYVNDNLKMTDFDLEKDAIMITLNNFEEYKVVADVMIIGGEIVGFALGELLPSGIGVIYFEKADIEYKGIYTVLDNEFIKRNFAKARAINKQEDMGLEGLRKAKLSYHPISIIDRFTAWKC